MLKKSLKIGSILLLIFAMVAFIGCDSGSGDTDPEETPVGPGPGPGPDDPDVPPPPVETITGITIDPTSLEILAGERQLFTATVSGTAADKTVTWTVGIADADYYNKKEDGTTITPVKGSGLLVIDAGQYPGTLLTVTAVSNADPSVFAEATVKVVKPGPRLAWTPNFISVSTGDDGAIDEDATSVGRLLDIYGKDIRLFDGEYLEGQHYYIRRVDNLNNSIQGGTITVTGSADEGTVTVTLNGNVIGDKGPIGITLYQSVLEGTDAAAIDLEAAELVYNVTSSYLITSLTTLPQFEEPLRGSVPVGPVVGNLTYGGISVDEIKWTGLTSGTYTHRTPAVATITLKAKSGYKFYSLGISESTIKAKFINGSPEVAILTNSGSTLKFTLTYTVTAKTINVSDPTTSGDTSYVGANFASVLEDFISQGVLSHNQEAPVALRVKGESPYYSLTEPVTWEGLSGKNFFGGKLAVATVTIPAKPGYTFEGTDIKAENLAGGNGIFKLGGDIDHDGTGAADAVDASIAEIISAGDSLVFKLSYYVPRLWITNADIGAYVSGKLPSAVEGATPVTNLTVSKNAPFTGGSGAVSWTGLSTTNKFSWTLPAKATVTLLAKDGYEFSTAGTAVNGGFASTRNDITPTHITTDASVTGASVTTTFNLGNKLVFEVNFNNAVRKVVDDLYFFTGTLTVSGGTGKIEHVDTAPSVTVTASANAQINTIGSGATDSRFTWGPGVFGGTFNYNRNEGVAQATLVLKPKAKYTFTGFSTSNTDNIATIKELFGIYGITPDVTLSTTTGSNDLTVTLKYPIARKEVTISNYGDLLGTFENSYNDNFGIMEGQNVTNVPESVWDFTLGSVANTTRTVVATWDKGAAASVNTNNLAVGNDLIVKITVAANPGYKLSDVDTAAINTMKGALTGITLAYATPRLYPSSDDAIVLDQGNKITAAVALSVKRIPILASSITQAMLGAFSPDKNFSKDRSIAAYSWNLNTTALAGIKVTGVTSITAIRAGQSVNLSNTNIIANDDITATATLTAMVGYEFTFVSGTDNITIEGFLSNNALGGSPTGATLGTPDCVNPDSKTIKLTIPYAVNP